jgi:DNA-binding transcriptional MerR regulator/methylmalonyl-CoA mutase cobalamin-binding subunit
MAKQPDNTARQEEQGASLYPIRTVSTLTGVHTVTLRAWERRYGLIRPVRTASGHRLYTQAQIDLINRVLVLLDKGIPISQVRAALDSTIEPAAAREPQASPWARYRERMVSAITRFDENGLEEAYNEALSLYPVDLVTRHLLLPLLVELGTRWETAEGSVAEEHFFGVYLRNKLGARFHHRPRGNTGPRLLLACLPGELHEIGVLLFALAAHDHGYRVILLGANTPLEDLPTAVRRAAIDLIVLSGSIEPESGLLDERLPKLVGAARIPVCVGGLTSVKHRDTIVAAGAIALGADIEPGLRRLREIAAPASA